MTMVLTHCLPPTHGALQPETPPTMRSRAAGTFDATFAIKINVAIIIIITQPVYLCRRTPFMISSLHATKMMMLNIIMTHEEGLWISMQPLCLCRRTPFILTFGIKLVCLKFREFYRAIRVSYWDNFILD